MSLGMLCRSFLIPLLLLMAQQGAVLHALSHFFAPDTRDQPAGQQLHGGPCELCLAFAHLDAAARPEPAVIAPVVFRFEAVAVSEVRTWAPPAPPEQSRGPPNFL